MKVRESSQSKVESLKNIIIIIKFNVVFSLFILMPFVMWPIVEKWKKKKIKITEIPKDITLDKNDNNAVYITKIAKFSVYRTIFVITPVTLK